MEGGVMKIVDANIQMASSRSAAEEHRIQESLTVWQNAQAPRTVTGEELQAALQDGVIASEDAFRVSISAETVEKVFVLEAVDPEEMALSAREAFELSLLKLLVERLTGKKIKLVGPADIAPGDCKECVATEKVPDEQTDQGWGLIYSYNESYYEAEQTSFTAEGVIRTADGREIDFSVELRMSREFLSQQSIDVRAGDALKDPLVINYAGRAAELSSTHFAFDLDLDGRKDQIAFLRPGSGFLALDRNSDGIVNDGSELFGPETGNGFQELATHDQDMNGWIDENDPIFNRLRIWQRDDSGNNRLFALGKLGIGAIYLGNISTPFALKNQANEQEGAVRSSGVFVSENGMVGTVQQVDMVV